jgi:hypothetical protein
MDQKEHQMKRLACFAFVAFVPFASFAQQPVTGSGTAGTAATGVLTVQGIASGLAIAGNITQVAGTTLGAISNYGTSPGAVAVPAVNAYVTNALSVSPPTPSTSSTYAFTMYHHVYAGTGLNVKASAGNLYGFSVFNGGTIPCYFQLYNTAGTPTIGTSVIDSYGVQAGVTLSIPPGQLALENFSTGIGIGAATADAGATTTGCTTISATVYYN